MSTLTKEQVMAKLEKLLKLAGNKGATEAEMTLAMQKATTLAMEHNIDLSSVDVNGKVEVEAIETDYAETHTKTKQEQPYHVPIMDTIKAVLGVDWIVSTWTDHNAMRHITRIVSKRSYFRGLRDGIISNNRRAKENLPEDLKNRYALVLVNKNQLVQARVTKMFPKLKPLGGFTMNSDAEARAAGEAKGATIKLNGGLTGGSNQGQLK